MSAESVHRILPERAHRSYRHYLGHLGGDTLARARSLGTRGVLAELDRSGLRGRGGAGFPTARKWRTVAQSPHPTRFVVCNAAEGEPGTFKDRWLLRHNPYAVLEGMLVAAQVIGTRSLHIGIKASFQEEYRRLLGAARELRAAGALEGIELRIVRGPEEYLFGEEKALLEVLSGNEPLPRDPDNPPYEVGLFPLPGSPNPALVNNVQTFAHVPSILLHGGDSFRAIGSADTPGTVLYTLSGDLRTPGIYEAPAGLTLAELFEDFGGGPRNGRPLKLALCGVSAAAIPASAFDTPADFGALARMGSALGSAGFVAYDTAVSAPRIAQMAARFLYVESCNQCSPCKAGLRKASEALDELFDVSRASPDDVEWALSGARSAPQANRCYLPVQGSLLIPSLIRLFPEEFRRQVEEPAQAGAPVPIPKMVDYDENGRRFSYDSKQSEKRPDWTYEPTARTSGSPSPPA
jgi:NADH:ubiquinone oxidoreductase subunit F (NADH-binding)